MTWECGASAPTHHCERKRSNPSCNIRSSSPAKAGIQYAAASRPYRWRLWNTGSPAFAGDDERIHSRGARRPRFANNFRTPSNKGCAGMPGARCTRGLVCIKSSRRTRAYRSTEITRHPRTQRLYGLSRALLGARALWPPSPAVPKPANLTPASRECRDHTLFPYASGSLRHKDNRQRPSQPTLRR